MLQVNLSFVATDSYVRGVAAGRRPRNTPAEHIKKFYSAFSEVNARKFDGLIISGVNALKPRIEEETIWPEVADILQWSTTNAFSSMFLCWGAKAALKFFHNIDSHKAERKLFGLFEHRLLSDKTGLFFGFPDRFPAPVSRWKSPRREDIARVAAIEIIADSEEAGPNMLVEAANGGAAAPYPRRVYVLNHPEYETETLAAEYFRDSVGDPDYPLPRHYFPNDDPSQRPPNLWRHTAHLYTNWVKTVYEATPYDLAAIPNAER
jgi:homoserine O-succinyltransferase